MTEQVTRTQDELYREFMLDEWPRFISLFPGSPSYVGDGPFEQKATDMVRLAIEAGCGISGAKLNEEELRLASTRPVKDFITYIRSTYNRGHLLNQYRLTRDLWQLENDTE